MGNDTPRKLMWLMDKNVTGFQNLICATKHACWAVLHHRGVGATIGIGEYWPVPVTCCYQKVTGR